MVCGDVLRPESLAQVSCDALDHAPGVGKDKRGVVLADQRRNPVVQRLPHFIGHHCFQRRIRQDQRKVACPAVATVDDHAGIRCSRDAGEEVRDFLDGLLCCGKADALQATSGQSRQPLQRKRQVRAALGGGDCVDFVDDHAARARQHDPSGLAGQQQVQ